MPTEKVPSNRAELVEDFRTRIQAIDDLVESLKQERQALEIPYSVVRREELADWQILAQLMMGVMHGNRANTYKAMHAFKRARAALGEAAVEEYKDQANKGRYFGPTELAWIEELKPEGAE